MTAPSLSLPAGTLAAARQQLRGAPLVRALAALSVVVAAAFVSHLAAGDGRQAVDAGVLLIVATVAAAALTGLRGGVLTGAVAVVYGIAFYAQPPWVDADGNNLRVLLFVFGSMVAAVVTGSVRDRLDRVAGGVGSVSGMIRRAGAFGEALASARPEALPGVVVAQAVVLAEADMAVLTIVDRRTGRHVVRAVHGTSRGALGVEVLPGVGLAGQALRDERAVVVGQSAPRTTGLAAFRTRLISLLDDVPPPDQPRTPAMPPAMALPLRHASRVVATLTLGRSDPARPFTEQERQVIELVAPHIGLAIANGLLRGQLREASLRDSLTGLYNRSYLDAALDQLLALRRRTPPEQRPPVSLILFAVDGFREVGERHGPAVAEQIMRAMAALLRQRFRESDTIARVDADGFLVVMDSADLKVAGDAAGLIRAKVREMALRDERGAPLSISVSAGCATFRDDVARSEELLRTVRAALDTARWSGPGSVVAI